MFDLGQSSHVIHEGLSHVLAQNPKEQSHQGAVFRRETRNGCHQRRMTWQVVYSYMIIMALFAFAGCKRQTTAAGPQTVQQATRDDLPDWTFTESKAEFVGPIQQVGVFTIRPPADFRFIKETDAPKSYIWAGPIRPDETYPTFLVLVQQLPKPNPYSSIDAILDDVMKGIQAHRTNWSVTPSQHGSIFGQIFARASWSGIANSTARQGLVGKEMHGVVYVTVQDEKVIEIMCEDAASDYAQWLKRGEAAASTVQKASVSATRDSKSAATSPMPIYITPFYASNGPQISVGEKSKALQNADADTILQLSNELKKQRDKLRVEVMYVLAIRLYDLGQKDEAIYWFYTAQFRARVFGGILADSKALSGAFELKEAYNAFFQLVGPYVNGYAFGDLASLEKTLLVVLEESKSMPNYAELYPGISFVPEDKRAETNAEVSKGLSDLIESLKTNAAQIKEQRAKSGVEGKY